MGRTARDKVEQLLKQAEAGELLQQIRADRGLSLASVGEEVGCSANYLSEIERGLKVPSDVLLRKLSRFYEIEEAPLYGAYGKVPLTAFEELENNIPLQKTLLEIGRNKSLTEEKKHVLYDKMYRLYQEFLKDSENEGGGE